jgi:hypothetical protein
MASVMIDEIRLRSHARPLDEREPGCVCTRSRWVASWAKRTGVSAAALREVGVPASVLSRVGLL